jgi:hypothetical protein
VISLNTSDWHEIRQFVYEILAKEKLVNIETDKESILEKFDDESITTSVVIVE